jgi:ribosomal 50S subunit-associated protein YjgA (DUF615 family)
MPLVIQAVSRRQNTGAGKRGLRVMSVLPAVTVDRIERAIATTAYCMAEHNLPRLLPTLKRLEAERDKLIANGDPIEYARRLLVHRKAA